MACCRALRDALSSSRIRSAAPAPSSDARASRLRSSPQGQSDRVTRGPRPPFERRVKQRLCQTCATISNVAAIRAGRRVNVRSVSAASRRATASPLAGAGRDRFARSVWSAYFVGRLPAHWASGSESRRLSASCGAARSTMGVPSADPRWASTGPREGVVRGRPIATEARVVVTLAAEASLSSTSAPIARPGEERRSTNSDRWPAVLSTA